ncbi:hypothetical protein [Kumtagia ephedrae]|uniref:Uncharacterized protein n=1 Tax=Kumtagia ephedrae TaxID=2116701 RepID=A0A2P7SPI4_9HYPH|nr:hypothetical protein [Mesorhizobium ephedrae]PSJ64372.1 hypothetical protein C7I84_05310 [Mesorhizobium ephedrae]
MRAILTSLMAFFLSLLAGIFVAQWLALATGATEEFILVFASVPVLAVVFALVFLLPQVIGRTRASIDRAGKWSLAALVVAIAALLAFELWAVAGDTAKLEADLPMIAGLVLPGLAIVLVDWLFVRWRVGMRREGFGRNGTVS